MMRTNFPKVTTIGVYGFDETGFYEALQNAGVDLFCDIRLRRGMRGSQYAFVNATYLQKRLAELGIEYLHIKELAPSKEIREHQKKADASSGVLKSTRLGLGDVFTKEYEAQCLHAFDFSGFLSSLPEGVSKVAFFCVEREPQACHRSLVTNRIQSNLNIEPEHILP